MEFVKETPATILAWATETFGAENISAVKQATRTNSEIAELITALVHEDEPERIRGELADVAIMLWQVAELTGFTVKLPDSVTGEPGPERAIGITLALARNLNLFLACAFGETDIRDVNDASSGRVALRVALDYLNLLAVALQVDLAQAVQVKMNVNRLCRWAEVGNGHFQHMRSGDVLCNVAASEV